MSRTGLLSIRALINSRQATRYRAHLVGDLAQHKAERTFAKFIGDMQRIGQLTSRIEKFVTSSKRGGG